MSTIEAVAAARAHQICVRLLKQDIAEGAAPHSIALRQLCLERAATVLGRDAIRRRQPEPTPEPTVTAAAVSGELEAPDMPVQEDDRFALLRRQWAEPRPVPADRPSHADVLVRGAPITEAPDGEAVWVAEERPHWADDLYWTGALDAFQRRRGKGLRFLTIDLDAVDRVAFLGVRPAYRLMDAMAGVEREEGWEDHKGTPRVLLTALLRLAELSGTTGRIPRTKAATDEADGSG